MSEKELVRLLRAKDDRGFRQLMQYYPMCKQMMRKLGVDENSCEDIFQESLMVLYEKLQKKDFQLTAKVSTYLYKVCQNIAKAYRWKKSKMEVVNPSSVPDDRGEEGYFQRAIVQGLSEEFEDELPNSEELYQAIVALDSPCKDILSMFYYHKARIKEIMLELGYPNENATRQAKYQCIIRLKTKFLR